MRKYNYVFLVAVLALIAALQAHAQSMRQTLWLDGPGPTSARLDRLSNAAELTGYDFSEIFLQPYFFEITANNIPNWSTLFRNKLNEGNHTNVLGIGHDVGGLVLRQIAADQTDGRLSAMVLVGTPNQGGKVLNRLLSNAQGDLSDAQEMARDMLNYRTGAQSCQACRMIEASQTWFDRFSTPSMRSFYSGINPTANSLPAPAIPTAVIWGNENGSLPLTRLLSSLGDSGVSGDDSGYLDCYQDEIRDRRQEVNDRHLLAIMRSIATLAGGFGRMATSTNPFAIGVAIEATIRAQADLIESSFRTQRELREILECELIHQGLNAKWVTMVANYTLVQETIEVPCPVACDQCWIDFESDNDEQVLGYCLSVCHPACEGVLETYTIEYLVPELHDALFTDVEQKLAGAAKTYEAKGCNHLQEPFWAYEPISDAFTDLFNGGAGAAFVVPQ